MSNRRQQGSAIVFALMSIILVGALAAATFNRTTFTEQRSGTARQKDRSELAADASLQMAIRAVQRTGSSSTNETGPNGAGTADDKCSPIDGPVRVGGGGTVPQVCFSAEDEPQKKPLDSSKKGYVNGIDSADGLYSYVVRGGVPNDNMSTQNVDERLVREITAYGYYNGKTAKRTLKFLIVPRAFKFGIFSGLGESSSGGIQTGIEVANGGRLLLPPAYAKKTSRPRGSDIAANGNIVLGSGSQVNYRTDSSSSYNNQGLYDKYFVDNGTTATSNASSYYGGAPWGDIFQNNSAKVLYNGVEQTSFPIAGGSGTNASPINFDGNVLKTQFTELPTYATTDSGLDTPMGYFKNLATNNTSNSWAQSALGRSTNNSVYTIAEFQQLLNNTPSPVQFTGMVYVDNTYASNACTLIVGVNQLVIRNGGLIVRGCDVDVQSDSSIIVTHVLKTAGSDTNKLPGLMVLKSIGGGNTFGGNLTVRSTKTSGGNRLYTDIQGVVYADKNILVNPTEDTSSDTRGNFNVNGAVIAGGSFRLAPTGSPGTGSAVVRWNPLAQRMLFSTKEGDMGTYSIRTADRPPPNIPQVTIDQASKPENPSPKDTAHFTWNITGSADTVECRLIGSSGAYTPQPTYGPCESLADPLPPTATPEQYGSYGNLTGYRDYTFSVQVCNVSGCANDDYTWRRNPTGPKVNITSTPPNPQTGEDHVANGSTITWNTLQRVVETDSSSPLVPSAIESMKCTIDSGTPVDCGTINGDRTTSNTTKTYTGLARNTAHTFFIEVCNVTGCASASYTWTIRPVKPTLSWSQVPAQLQENPSGVTTMNQTFTFKSAGDAVTSWTCRANGTTTISPCPSSGPTSDGVYTVTANFATCTTQSFTVTATNAGGTSTITDDFRVKCAKPIARFSANTNTTEYTPGWYASGEGGPYISFQTINGTSAYSGATGCRIVMVSDQLGGTPPGTTWNCATQLGSGSWNGTSGGGGLGLGTYCNNVRYKLEMQNESGWSDPVYITMHRTCTVQVNNATYNGIERLGNGVTYSRWDWQMDWTGSVAGSIQCATNRWGGEVASRCTYNHWWPYTVQGNAWYDPNNQGVPPTPAAYPYYAYRITEYLGGDYDFNQFIIRSYNADQSARKCRVMGNRIVDGYRPDTGDHYC